MFGLLVGSPKKQDAALRQVANSVFFQAEMCFNFAIHQISIRRDKLYNLNMGYLTVLPPHCVSLKSALSGYPGLSFDQICD